MSIVKAFASASVSFTTKVFPSIETFESLPVNVLEIFLLATNLRSFFVLLSSKTKPEVSLRVIVSPSLKFVLPLAKVPATFSLIVTVSNFWEPSKVITLETVVVVLPLPL